MGPIWPLITLLIIMLFSFLFQIWKYYTITTINPWSQCLRREMKNNLCHFLQKSKISQKIYFISARKAKFYRLVHKFYATGLDNNLNKKVEHSRSGKKLTARCPDSVDTVRDSVGRSPKKSPRRRFQELGLLRASWQNILKNIFTYTRTESWSSINSHQLTWSYLHQ